MIKTVRFFTSSIQRRTLSSFAIVIVLVLAMAMAGYYQLNQVRSSSEQVIPSSSQMGLLQDFVLSISSLDANLERFLVIGGAQYRENVLQDLGNMTDTLESMKENASGEERLVSEEMERGISNRNTSISG